jgi:para-aminobenzoate synthetase
MLLILRTLVFLIYFVAGSSFLHHKWINRPFGNRDYFYSLSSRVCLNPHQQAKLSSGSSLTYIPGIRQHHSTRIHAARYEYVSPTISMKEKRSKLPIRSLLIDNYDSYTYNLWQLLASVNGIPPLVIQNDQYSSWEELISELEGKFDNIVLSPGPGTPNNPADIGVSIDSILKCKAPLLGVCLGHQSIGLANGGSVIRAPEQMHGRLSKVYHDDAGLFQNIPNPFNVVRYHSLLVEDSLSANHDLLVTAKTSDGVIMGLKHKHKPIYGVQFHPESIATEYGRKVLENFYDITLSLSSSATSDCDKVMSLVADFQVRPVRTKLIRNIYVSEVPLAPSTTASSLFQHLYANQSASFWLDSAIAGISSDNAVSNISHSFMGCLDSRDDYSVEYYAADGERNEVVQRYAWGRDPSQLEHHGMQQNIFEYIHQRLELEKDVLTSYHRDYDAKKELASSMPWNLPGMMFGYIGYEARDAASQILHANQTLDGCFNYSATRSQSQSRQRPYAKELSHPLALFLCPSRYIVIDHTNHRAYVVTSTVSNISDPQQSRELAAELKQRINDFQTLNPTATHATNAAANERLRNPSGVLISNKSPKEYLEDIESSMESIRAGDTYEVCLTMQFDGEASINDSLKIYNRLRRHNAAPYACYLRYDPYRAYPQQQTDSSKSQELGLRNMPVDGFAVLCSSPERYLKITDGNLIETKPIKGTARRDKSDADSDAVIAYELEHDEKSRAENLMIVDLMRNDLGRICEIGSVHVPFMMKVESFASVHQLVTTIRGRLADNMNIADALVATFPGGSMTGAPKRRTMEIIDALEQRPRGIYSGTIGYISMNGAADLNIAIRTAYMADNQITVGSGGAIVILSDPKKVSYQYHVLVI